MIISQSTKSNLQIKTLVLDHFPLLFVTPFSLEKYIIPSLQFLNVPNHLDKTHISLHLQQPLIVVIQHHVIQPWQEFPISWLGIE